MRLELTKRGDYAIRAALALARAESGERLSVRRISEDMSIPVRFLPQVMADLVRAGLATAAPGRNGGYVLARPPAELTLLDVIEAVEGDSRRQTCVLRGGPCGASGFCDVHDVFFAAQDRMLKTLASTTLERLPRRLGARIGGPEHRPNALE